MTLISIVMPLYNKAPYVAKTINSIQRQTFQDFQIIVVNDGSTDGGEHIVKSIGDPRIRLINQTNAGVSAARNRGVAEAQADFIAFLDADDEWKPEFLENIWDVKEKFPEAGIWATAYDIEEGNSMRVVAINSTETDFYIQNIQAYIDYHIKYGPIFFTSSLMLYKPIFQEIGGFQEGISRGEDLDVWFQMARKAPVAYRSKRLAIYNKGLPLSICSTYTETKKSRLVESLEREILKCQCDNFFNKSAIDYLAWRKSLPVHRLLLSGNRREARRLIHSAWFSKKLRKKCIWYYLQSLLPVQFLDFYSKHVKGALKFF